MYFKRIGNDLFCMNVRMVWTYPDIMRRKEKIGIDKERETSERRIGRNEDEEDNDCSTSFTTDQQSGRLKCTVNTNRTAASNKYLATSIRWLPRTIYIFCDRLKYYNIIMTNSDKWKWIDWFGHRFCSLSIIVLFFVVVSSFSCNKTKLKTSVTQ